jgi:tetratricopeptide (TPR) repeat protein
MNRKAGAVIACVAIAALCGCASNRQHSTLLAASLPSQAELTQVPFFAQDRYQCGPAALATVLQSTGLTVTPQELTPEVYLPGRKGALQVELVAAARARDRLAYPVAGDLTALLEQVAAGRPVLVLQNLGVNIAPMWHFAVVVGYDLEARTLILRSGTTERLVTGTDRFMRTWDRGERWALVVLESGQLPASPDLDRYVKAAASLEAVGRLDAAERAYSRAREQWPRSVWPPLGIANISYKRGDLPAAESGYAAALELDPNNVVAHNNLAEILATRGCVDRARVHIDQAATLARGTTLESGVSATKRQIDAAAIKHAVASCESQSH